MIHKRRISKKSINFTIMIVGESGMGRSSFINTLCGSNSVVKTSHTVDQDIFGKKLNLRKENVELEDNDGHKILLNIIDSPNFGLQSNCEEDFKIIVDFIRHQYDEVLLEESRVNRNTRFKDGRIHVLIYMINPTGHGLSEIDIHFMLHVNNLVNIIPVIAKADSLTPEELKLNKQLILEDLQRYKIKFFTFVEKDYDLDYSDDEIMQYNKYLNTQIPFGIICANEFQNSGNNEETDLKFRVLNPINTRPINTENPKYSDFAILKNVLLITHLSEFKEITQNLIYENYRTDALSGKKFQYTMGFDNDNNHNSASNGSSLDVKELNYLEKEEQIKLEEERLRKFEEKVHLDLISKRKELLERENELKDYERKLIKEGLKITDNISALSVSD